MPLPNGMPAKLLDPKSTTGFYDSGPWQNGEQGWLFQGEVFRNRLATCIGILTAQVPRYTKQNPTSQQDSIPACALLDHCSILGLVSIDARSEHTTTTETVDNFLRFFGASPERMIPPEVPPRKRASR